MLNLVKVMFLCILSLVSHIDHINGQGDQVYENYMKEINKRFCEENDHGVLVKLRKCQLKNAPQIKQMEDECMNQIRNAQKKQGEPTLEELRDIQCDRLWSEKFSSCLFKKFNKAKMAQLNKLYPPPMLDNIAKDIMKCDFDVYGIRHD